jgi:hypothetical protein
MKKHYELQYKNPGHNRIYLINGEIDDFVLRASPLDKEWSRPGEVFLSFRNTGNGLVVTFKNREESLRLNYCEAEELRLALKINQPEVGVSEIIKKAVK